MKTIKFGRTAVLLCSLSLLFADIAPAVVLANETGSEDLLQSEKGQISAEGPGNGSEEISAEGLGDGSEEISAAGLGDGSEEISAAGLGDGSEEIPAVAGDEKPATQDGESDDSDDSDGIITINDPLPEAVGADYKFTSSKGKFTVKTVNTGNNLTTTSTVNVTVDTKTNMATSGQDASYTVTNSGNWQNISVGGSRNVMGVVSESGDKSKTKFVLYDMISVPKPAGYIVSSYSIADYYGGNVDGYGVGATLRWSFTNSGVEYGSVADNKYFIMKTLDQYAPPLQNNDQRFNNTYPTAETLKLMFVTNCRNAGLRLDSQASGVKNMTITINYKPAAYTVVYQTNGGSGVSNTAATYDKAFTLPTPVRAGYTFTGWSGSGLSNRTGNVSNLTAVNGAVVALTAGWRPNNYKVRYNSNGGNNLSDATVVYDTDLSLPVPQRSGYIFMGWNGAGLTSKTGTVRNLSTKDQDTVTLSAGWKPITYKLRLTKEAGEYDETELNYDQDYELPILEKEGYIFDGWSGGGLVKKTGTISNLTAVNGATVELTAEWTKKEESLNKGAESGDNKGNKGVVNQYINEYGLSEEQAIAILDALTKGSVARLRISGTEFSFAKNEDGSITIKLAGVDEGGRVVIPNEVTIGDLTYPVTHIDKECFKNNEKIREVVLGNHITTIGESAFEGCKNLTGLTTNEGLTTIGNKAFYNCSSLGGFTAPSTLQSIGNSAFEGCSKLSTLSLDQALLSIGKRAFYNCTSLKKLTIPKKVLVIGAQAFAKCTSLTKVTYVQGAELMKMGKSVFEGDKKLSSLSIPKGLTQIPDKAFYGCKKLKKVTLPSKVQKIGKQAFYKCSKLQKVSIKSKNLTKVGKQAFIKCKKKIRFNVPKGKMTKYMKLMKGKY